MYERTLEAQVAEYAERAARAGEPVRPLFLVFEDGPEIPAGRVLESNGDIVFVNGVPFVCLWLPVSEARGDVSTDCMSDDGKSVIVGQSADGCTPLNQPAEQMCGALRQHFRPQSLT
jgi:hypothetical protein